MKSTSITIVLAICAVLGMTLASCQKVIDIDLNAAEPRFVIQARIVADTNDAEVLISSSTAVNNSNSFSQISGANVRITDALGNVVQMNEVQPGIYRNAALRGVVGMKYTLDVDYSGKHFSAQSTVPVRVACDSLQIDSLSFFGFKNYIIIPRFVDPIGLGNNYRFILVHNDTTSSDIIVRNDEFSDGLLNKRPLDTQVEFHHGDSVVVSMQCIDEGVYTYLLALAQLSQGGNQVTPTNPPSNIQGGALGYFNACTMQVLKTRIP